MHKHLHTLLFVSLVAMFFSCKKEDDNLYISNVKSQNLTSVTTTTKATPTTTVAKEDGFISGVINGSTYRFAMHTLDCKGQPTNEDNSFITFADGTKQLDLIRNATTYVGSDRWEIVSGDNIDKMKLPATLTGGSLAWTHAVSGSTEVVYRGILGAGAVVTITSKVGNRLQGTFTGSLRAENSSPEASTLQVINGTFDIVVVNKVD